MNKKIALLLSLLLGVAAVALMFSYIQKTTDAKTKGWDMQTVLVANADLPIGTVLSEDNTAARPYPSKYIAGRVLTPDAAEVVFGGVLTVAAERGKPIMWTDVQLSIDTALGLAADLAANTRAITIPITQVTSLNGMLRPGMYVDVLWTGDSTAITPPAPPPPPEETDTGEADSAAAPSAADIQDMMLRTSSQVAQNAGQPAKVTTVLLQNALIIAVGDQRGTRNLSGTPMAAYNTVTLMLPPESARILVHAMSAGSINLLLRHVGEADIERGPILVGPAEIADFLRKSTRQ
jgi:Flp pilus assembly protein CpaB